MVHLPPLPGSPHSSLSMGDIVDAALADVAALRDGGVDGLIIENFGDAPFFPVRVPDYTVASMAVVAREVRDAFPGPIGVNVLRNDALAALGIALAAGADFIRVNVLAGSRIADQGLLHGEAHELLRRRRHLDACQVRIFADVEVKHSAPLTPIPIAQSAEEMVGRGGADALIVSGPATGQGSSEQDLQGVVAAVSQTPVFVGSGVAPNTASSLARHAAGMIVGTALKRDGQVTNPVDVSRVKTLMGALR